MLSFTLWLVGLAVLGLPSAAAQNSAAPSSLDQCKESTDGTVVCLDGSTKYEVVSSNVPSTLSSLNGCHTHDGSMFCVHGGKDVEIKRVSGGEDDHDGHDHTEHEKDGDRGKSDEDKHDHGDHDHGDRSEGSDNAAKAENKSGRNCHFHAGVEHCDDDSDSDSALECTVPNRHYNVSLRIKLLFAILAASAIAVFAPILLQRVFPRLHATFTVIRQLGTGIIVSTAFVHLFTHASLQFSNRCVARYISYEATAAALLMAGLLLSFLVDYVSRRFMSRRTARTQLEGAAVKHCTDMTNILVLEAGIIFHSLLIGLTLVVADDSAAITLFIVVLFHQMFEGLALGSLIAGLGTSRIGGAIAADTTPTSAATSSAATGTAAAAANAKSSSDDNTSASSDPAVAAPRRVLLTHKLALALPFALITPVGMAIGIGVLNQFNGNDPTTIITIGTIHALSAGVLVWVGVVEMWAADWVFPTGELYNAGAPLVAVSLASLVAGTALMSLLGKWV